MKVRILIFCLLFFTYCGKKGNDAKSKVVDIKTVYSVKIFNGIFDKLYEINNNEIEEQ